MKYIIVFVLFCYMLQQQLTSYQVCWSDSMRLVQACTHVYCLIYCVKLQHVLLLHTLCLNTLIADTVDMLSSK